MKILMIILSVFVLISCSSKKRDPSWDDGAQKQDSIQEQSEYEQQEQIRNQFPGGRNF